jgi:hypothetical protein
MESKRICQSCSIPLNSPELLGTEKDGSPKKYYCKYCYENGQFTSPHITFEEMKIRVRDQMRKMKMDEEAIDIAVESLPNLKRWRKVVVAPL